MSWSVILVAATASILKQNRYTKAIFAMVSEDNRLALSVELNRRSRREVSFLRLIMKL